MIEPVTSGAFLHLLQAEFVISLGVVALTALFGFVVYGAVMALDRCGGWLRGRWDARHRCSEEV